MSVQYHYGKFPPASDQLNWDNLTPYIGPAHSALARYDAMLTVIPNSSVFLSPLTTQEAVLSSRIEGTQTTIEEVLEFEAGQGDRSLPNEKQDDINEVLNYRTAMSRGIELLNEMPFCVRIIKELHQILMSGVRGASKAPGEFRKNANWIGRPGCSIEEAKFVPVNANELSEAMSNWEKYIHHDFQDNLVKLAVVHAEFESLHPFLDGNGRLGRMSIPLFMYSIDLIHEPMFYISAFFEQNRDEYYDRLLAISRDDDWTGWCIFFLEAVKTQAQRNQKKLQKILSLYEQHKQEIVDLTHSQYSIVALDFIYSNPVFKSTQFYRSVPIPEPTAKRILNVLKNNKILNILRPAAGRRAGYFFFPELIAITEGFDEV